MQKDKMGPLGYS